MSELVYLDSSIVVAYYIPESRSERVQALFDANVLPTISELVELEVVAALSLRLRIGDLDRDSAFRVMRLFGEHVESGFYSFTHLQAGHYQWARDVVARFELPLKSPDALHLAAAWREGLRLITADRQLARNADALGVDFELIAP